MCELVLTCPKCDSTNVRPVNGAYMIHKCECGYTGDASQFSRESGQPVALDDDPLAEFFMFEEADEAAAEVIAWLP